MDHPVYVGKAVYLQGKQTNGYRVAPLILRREQRAPIGALKSK